MDRTDRNTRRVGQGVRPLISNRRIVLPKALCRQLGWGPGTAIAVVAEGDQLMLTRAPHACRLCGAEDAPFRWGGEPVCRQCAAEARTVGALRGLP